MADTLGSMCDKLSILNLKLWFIQDRVHKAAAQGEELDAETTKNLVAVNLERNRAIKEIDEILAEAISSGTVRVDSRVKLI